MSDVTEDRYSHATYRRAGRSGLHLPAISLGFWQNFGEGSPLSVQREIVLRAFERGVTHLDLANNYGPPPGSAETNVGEILRTDLAAHRDELIISTKAGYRMWPGPYGEFGSRKYLLASLDQSLGRLGLDYVDVFYSHRFDPDTPLEETIGALATAVNSGKALYAGISSYSAAQTRDAVAIARDLRLPLVLHQPSYSMVNRWIEEPEDGDGERLIDVVDDAGLGIIAFSPLAQGLLTEKYLHGVPDDSRAAADDSFKQSFLTDKALQHVRGLAAIAADRGQSLAQLALAWALRDPRVTSVLVGARTISQLDENLHALDDLDFSEAELRDIDTLAIDAGINIWDGRRNAKK